MVGWHHWLDGHEFEQALGDGEGQGSLVCHIPWGRKVGHDWATEQRWQQLLKTFSEWKWWKLWTSSSQNEFICLLLEWVESVALQNNHLISIRSLCWVKISLAFQDPWQGPYSSLLVLLEWCPHSFWMHLNMVRKCTLGSVRFLW